jgi:hypothetical protein
LETSGENHKDISRGGTYHSSIEAYLNANIPLTFIIVTSYDTAHKEDTLINEFLDELERKVIDLGDRIYDMGTERRMVIDAFEAAFEVIGKHFYLTEKRKLN